MSLSIGTTRVEEVMTTNIVTVSEADRIENVAKVFEKNDINAAPVVNEAGECVGIITNHDLAEYEATLEPELRVPGLFFNEVRFHMTKTLERATLDDPLSKVARKMLERHVHHIVILDDQHKLVGIVSSLDILGHLLGEPVCRKPKCGDSIDPLSAQ